MKNKKTMWLAQIAFLFFPSNYEENAIRKSWMLKLLDKQPFVIVDSKIFQIQPNYLCD